MDDKTYYDYLPLVNSFVVKWARSDTTLRYKIEEIGEDARSFAYCYWLQLLRKFNGDEDQAGRYYTQTVRLKLDSYLNDFYKQQLFQRRMKDGVITTYRENPVHICMDARDDYGHSLVDTAILNGMPELTTSDQYLPEDYKSYLDLFVTETPKKYKKLVRLMTENALLYSDEHPESALATRAGCYNIPAVATEMGLEIKSVRNMWSLARVAFVAAHPEIKRALREQ